MNNIQSLQEHVLKITPLTLFNNQTLLKYGSRSVVNRTLSYMAQQGVITRVTQGVYTQLGKTVYGHACRPGVDKVVTFIAKNTGETLQVHGAVAVNLLSLSTQVPLGYIYSTSGSSRKLKINSSEVTFRHVCKRKLAMAGSVPGLALTALWYMEKENVSPEVIDIINNILTPEDFDILRHCQAMPQWMKIAFEKYKAF